MSRNNKAGKARIIRV